MATWSDTVPSTPSAGDKFTYGGINYTYRVDNTMGVWDAVQGSREGARFAAAVNFDGTGTLSIRDSLNVASVTDLGTGLYQINFTTATITTKETNRDGTYGLRGNTRICLSVVDGHFI